MTLPTGSGWTCAKCGQWVNMYELHQCSVYKHSYGTGTNPTIVEPPKKNWKFCPHCGEELA
jgi:membrane protease subunit (stomatin/prohibitin family)